MKTNLITILMTSYGLTCTALFHILAFIAALDNKRLLLALIIIFVSHQIFSLIYLHGKIIQTTITKRSKL